MSGTNRTDTRPFVAGKTLPLDEWLSLVLTPAHERPVRVADHEFPSDAHRDVYLDTLTGRDETSVKALLRLFLLSNGTLGTDRATRHSIHLAGPERALQLREQFEFVRRLVEPPFLPWEGVTWILDLLPHYPARALDVLDAFFIAHCQFLPDGRAHGMADAEAVIRRRYLHWENPRESLLSLRPREFEFLIAALYKRMGYEVKVTQASRDGGLDVEALRVDPGDRAQLLIQCKRYEKSVGVAEVRQLMGVVARRQANKGVLIATCGFTKPAYQEAAENSMIELVSYGELNKLLNRHFGSRWPNQISSEIRSIQLALVKAHSANSLHES
jgi:restriction system protein